MTLGFRPYFLSSRAWDLDTLERDAGFLVQSGLY